MTAGALWAGACSGARSVAPGACVRLRTSMDGLSRNGRGKRAAGCGLQLLRGAGAFAGVERV